MGFVTAPFRTRVKVYLDRSGMTNLEVIKQLGISPGTWARYKRNPAGMPVGVLWRLAKILNMTSEEILEAVTKCR